MSATLRRSPLGKRSDCASRPTVLPDHGLAVPGQVGGRLTFSGSGIHVGGQAALRRRAREQRAVVGATDRDRAAGQVGQHRRTRQRRFGTRRDRDEHVLADLDVQHEAGHVGCLEQQIRAERRLDPGDPDSAALVITRRDLAALVELAVGGQIRLGCHTQDGAAVDDHGGVVDAMPVAQRGADHQYRQQLGRCGDNVAHGVLDRVQQHVLQQDVLDGVAGQRQFRENGQRHTLVVALAGQPQHRGGVGRGVADRGVMSARGDPGKPLVVDVVEVHRSSIVALDALFGDYRVPLSLLTAGSVPWHAVATIPHPEHGVVTATRTRVVDLRHGRQA